MEIPITGSTKRYCEKCDYIFRQYEEDLDNPREGLCPLCETDCEVIAKLVLERF